MATKTASKPNIGDKRAAILQGTLNLVAERGFHDTPMSQIAREAGVSAGIIYHYFENKDELMVALYREIKADLLATVMAGYQATAPLRERYLSLWQNMLRYPLAHPQEMRFLEQFENSPYYDAGLQVEFAEAYTTFLNFYQEGVAAGVLKDIDMGVMAELSFGVAVALAKQHIRGALQLDDALIAAAAAATWDAVAV